MPLVAPKLDDRQFQDIVDEAKQRIPHYCQEWTDHNVSDPGVTLIELFAWMTDLLLYRLNQVPERYTIKFMEMLGIRLQEPIAAKAEITFWLSSAQKTAVTIPAGTEVASTQTETDTSITFMTNDDFYIEPPQLSQVMSRITTNSGKTYQTFNLRRLQAGFEGVDIFTATPQIDDALYFGFENDLSHHILGIQADFDSAGGAGVDPTLPPVIWESTTGDSEDRWQSCAVDMDTTKGMNSAGCIQIHLPSMGKASVNIGVCIGYERG